MALLIVELKFTVLSTNSFNEILEYVKAYLTTAK